MNRLTSPAAAPCVSERRGSAIHSVRLMPELKADINIRGREIGNTIERGGAMFSSSSSFVRTPGSQPKCAIGRTLMPVHL